MRFSCALLVAAAVLAFAAPGSAQTGGAAPFVAGEILVKFSPGASANARADAHRAGGGRPVQAIARTGVERVAVPAGDERAAIARYRSNPSVLYAEPNFIRSIPTPSSHTGSPVVPDDYYFDEQWGLHNIGQLFYCFPWINGELCFYIGTPDADIDAPEAWAISTGGAEVTVAVIDSGVDYSHPDLAAKYAGGDDFLSPDGDPMDDHGHGTHVAGIIAAAMNNPTGSPAAPEGTVGVAPNARILAYKVCAADGSCNDFAMQQAIARAVADGAGVINMSIGGPEISQSLYDAVQDAWTAGLVVVAAAGNAGNTNPVYPAAFDNVLSVAAFDEDHRRPSFSNYGDWVDLSAPGNVVMSTYRMAACGASSVPGDTGCYTWLSGTSMAAPHVSGAAALVLGRGDVSGNAQAVQILLGSADARGVDAVRLDSWTRYGGLNVHDALAYGWTNQPPVANAGPDQTVADADGDGVALVTLDGSASFDPDGSIVSHEWSEGGNVLGFGATLDVWLSVGVHTITLTVTDEHGGSQTDSLTVTVEPADDPGDTVTITKLAYNARRGQLTVEATSSAAPDASLTAFDAGDPSNLVELGPLQYNARKAKYAGIFTVASRPSSVLVVSSAGGSAAAALGSK